MMHKAFAPFLLVGALGVLGYFTLGPAAVRDAPRVDEVTIRYGEVRQVSSEGLWAAEKEAR
jgi:hypothetical protein